MDSDASDNFENLFEEGDEGKHKKLVENVLSLNKTQQLKKPSRTEPTLKISEFNLVKSITGDKGSVQIDQLTKALKDRKSRVKINEKVQRVGKVSRTLPKPLEKPQADRIRRGVAYEKACLELDRWEAIVTSNRASANLSFPLENDTKLEIKEAADFPKMWRLKSKLEEELEKVEPQVEEYHVDVEKEKFPLTMKEMLARRKEMAKLRAFQGYREAKARRQNKIKSKKYHRLLKRQKIKQKLAEFEELQKTNPEAALEKLEEIEKARVEERFNLRHKGTGQWARDKQVRAKYDKESRQVLAQQLAISRELTQKTKNAFSDSEEEGERPEVDVEVNKDNIWLNGVKPDKEVTSFLGGYKRYWLEANKTGGENVEEKENGDDIEGIEEAEDGEVAKNAQDKNEAKETIAQTSAKKTKKQKAEKQPKKSRKGESKKSEADVAENGAKEGESRNHEKAAIKPNKTKKKTTKKQLDKSQKKESENGGSKAGRESNQEETSVKPKKTKKKKTKAKKSSNESLSTSEWEVSTVEEGNSTIIEQMFERLEHKIEKKKLRNARRLEKKVMAKKPGKSREKKPEEAKVDLSMPSQKKRPIIDEELQEDPKRSKNDGGDDTTVETLKKILATETKPEETKKAESSEPREPPQVTSLSTAVPDIVTAEEDDDNPNNLHNLISEALEDEDLVQDFTRDKKAEIEKSNPKSVDLSLPGWGSWGGPNIAVNKRKRRRLTFKVPEKFPRRDDNKGSLIINEEAQKKIKDHLVSELPFPFKTVKDFEASVRAPIGNTFVTEKAFKKLVRPAVTTKMGTVIEPMSKELLLNKK